ncbi:MAG: hypothetical protein CSA70_10470 [Rhodobacterales bacterium]|nr:MAG: hypothetical protein CSA70_10470 [Rhodobacterales bacterium]
MRKTAIRVFVGCTAVAGLVACTPTIPDSGAGVGFGNYTEYQKKEARREAQLTGQALPSPQAVSSEPLSASAPRADGSSGSAASVAQETQAVLSATGSGAGSGNKVVHASPSNPAPVSLNNPGISDENDFNAVGGRRTIQDDAALRKQQQAQYQQIQPTAVPTRVGAGGPNIVEYALSTTHPVGSSQYRRVGINLQAKYQKNCAKFPSPDLAQAEFLAKGGPSRDRLGLDPDGDGYACSWNPAPFRAVKAAAG